MADTTNITTRKLAEVLLVWELRNIAALSVAWLLFAAAISLHVLDEASHNFLSVYNPSVEAIRARLPFFPLPTFAFRVWLATPAIGIAVFLCFAPFAFRGGHLGH